MLGLSLVLWGKDEKFAVRWTGTDIVQQLCEGKPASFPVWKHFQCLYRSRLHLEKVYKAKHGSLLAFLWGEGGGGRMISTSFYSFARVSPSAISTVGSKI